MPSQATKRPRSCQLAHPEPAATAWRCTECAAELTGQGNAFRRPGLCAHLGEQIRLIECDSCTGRVSLKVFRCPIRGEVTLAQRLRGIDAVCDECLQWSPAPSKVAPAGESAVGMSVPTDALVSPIGTAGKVDGNAAKKPWQFTSTAIIPHLDTPETLEVVIELLRLQTDPPYIIVVDTGSPAAAAAKIERLRSDDVEIHFIRSNAYLHSSEPVTVALDVGLARANTPLLFLTHTDCFPRRRDALEWLGNQCDAVVPVVGWEMSERSWITDDWQGMVSHTFTMLHAPTIRRIGATWHMGRCREAMGWDCAYRADGWPDTETGFAYCLRAAGVPVKLLGSEVNYERQVTEWWDHARSWTGTKVYCKGTDQAARTEAYTNDALADARARIAAWSKIAVTPGQPLDVPTSTAPVKMIAG